MADLAGRYTVGTSASQLDSRTINEELILKASASNTGIIYVGVRNSGVTAGGTAATDGFPLSAGESFVITPYMCGRDSSTVYVISDTASQSLFATGF